MQAASSTPLLPDELVSQVFEHAPKTTLITCSTVCRSWRDMSTPTVFHKIAFSCKPIDPQGEMGHRPRRAYKNPKNTLASFLAFLQQSPRIAKQIHDLSIDMCHASETTAYFYDSDADYLAFVDVLRCMPRLENLALVDILLPNRPSDALANVKLQHLTVRYSQRTIAGDLTNNDLLRMLQLFGGISRISLMGVALDNGDEPALPFPLQLGVTTLDIQRGEVDSLLDSLELCLTTDTALRTLVVRDIHMDEISRVNLFLNITGPHFTHFGWSIPLDPDMNRAIDIVNLEPCINLRTLSLWMYWDGSAFPAANRFALEYLLGVLSGLPIGKPTSLLDQLWLILRFRPLSYTAAHGSLESARRWLRPVEDKLLGWTEQRVLRTVRIKLDRETGEKETFDTSFVAELFPRLHTAQVLFLEQ